MERNVGIFSVDLGGRSREDELLLLAGRFEDQLSAVYIGLDGFDGALNDEFDADGSGQMDDYIGIIHEFGEQLAILDALQVILHTAGGLEMADVFHAAGRKIVQQNDTIATIEEPLREM